jgi:DNA-binding NarL/FixJ family response regulator
LTGVLSAPARVLIVDDNPWFLEAARMLLEGEGLTIAGLATTTGEAISQVEALQPDIVLVDIALGKESGLDLAQELAEDKLGADAAIVLISTRSEQDFAEMIASSPAAGFVSKSELSASAIRRIVGARPC